MVQLNFVHILHGIKDLFEEETFDGPFYGFSFLLNSFLTSPWIHFLIKEPARVEL